MLVVPPPQALRAVARDSRPSRHDRESHSASFAASGTIALLRRDTYNVARRRRFARPCQHAKGATREANGENGSLLLLVFAAVIFAVQNADVVTVDVLFWKVDASLAIVVALCVTAGMLLGALISVPRIYRMRTEQRRLRAQLAEVDSSAMSELSKAKVRSPQPQQ